MPYVSYIFLFPDPHKSSLHLPFLIIHSFFSGCKEDENTQSAGESLPYFDDYLRINFWKLEDTDKACPLKAELMMNKY
jgi:hypothetical protein